MTERALAILLADDLAQVARLAHVLRHVRRECEPGLVVLDEVHRELHLLHGRDDALRLGNELGLAQPTGRLGRADEPLRVLRAHVAVDAVADRLGSELRDRVTRVDALWAALVAEEAPGALPDPVLAAVLLEPLDGGAVARVADEAHALRERLRAEELGIGLHRVALGHAAAAVDAECFLLDRVHARLADAVLLPVLGDVVAGPQPRADGAELRPERLDRK